jgi:Flp pilus assembly CpaF family ATPase
MGMDSQTAADLDEGDISTVVAMEIAAQVGKRVDETTPLAESIDPDALDRLFQTADRDLTVSFTHESHTVNVTPSGAEVSRTEPDV